MSVGDAEDEAMAIVHSLRALTVDLNVAVSGFANKYKMHSTDVRALICLLDAERSDAPATPGWLGAQLGINSASVTALVDRMVKAGHVARERDSADRRRVLLQVTPSAVTLGESFFGPHFTRCEHRRELHRHRASHHREFHRRDASGRGADSSR